MKAIPSIAYSEFRGTASDVTARHLGGRTVLNGRAQHSHVKTPGQSVRRASFAFFTKQFKTLSQDQIDAWANLASQHQEKALIGDGGALTAHNLFVCLNANRAILGVPMTKDAPTEIHGSSYIGFDDIWITPTKLLISGLQDPDTTTSRLVVKMATTLSSAVNSAWGQTVVVGKYHTSDWGDVDLTEIYTKQFGFPVVVGQRYFIEMYWIDELSGYVSQITRVCHTAVESASINGVEYSPRATIGINNVINDDMNIVDSIDFEISPGSKITSNDIKGHRQNSYVAGIIVKLKDIDSSALDYSSAFQWSRGTSQSSEHYAIALTEIYEKCHMGDGEMSISKRAGMFSHDFETFGTYLLY